MSSRRLIFFLAFFLTPFFSFQFVSAASGLVATSTAIAPVLNARFSVPSTCLLSNYLVRATFLSGNTQVSAGGNVTLSGTISNYNGYPVSDLSLVARVIKLPKRLGSSYDTATDTVDRIVPLTGIYINASTTASFSFTYQVPLGLVTGPYQVQLFLNGSDQFAIGGNEYLGQPLATYPLAVTGTQTQTSFFDLSTLKVNSVGSSAQFLSTITVPTATASVDIANTYTIPRNATINWYLYNGNFISPSALVATETDAVSLSPNTNSLISFTYDNFVHAKYLLVGELKDGNKESMFSLRIGRSDVVEPSVRSLYIKNFPLVSGKIEAVAGCITENSSNIVATTTVNLSLVGQDGGPLWSTNISYANIISRSFEIPLTVSSGFLAPLTLVIKATNQSGNPVTSSVVYSCVGNRCSSPSSSISNMTMTYVYIIIGLIIVVFLIVVFVKKKKSPQSQPNIPSI